MILNDDDRPIRIRPRKPPVARREGTAWAGGYRLLMHYARTSRKAGRNAGAQRATGAGRPHSQRCAVRVTYLQQPHARAMESPRALSCPRECD